MKDQKRYSMGFKLKVMEELREGKWKTVAEAGEAYGVTPTAIRYWMNRMGFEYLKGRIIYVKTASEVDEIKRLKAELRKAKEMLADEIISHKIDEATLRLACEELKTTPEILKKTPPRGRSHSRERGQALSRTHLRQAWLHEAGLLQGQEGPCAQGGQGGVRPRLCARGTRDESAGRNREGP